MYASRNHRIFFSSRNCKSVVIETWKFIILSNCSCGDSFDYIEIVEVVLVVVRMEVVIAVVIGVVRVRFAIVIHLTYVTNACLLLYIYVIQLKP